MLTARIPVHVRVWFRRWRLRFGVYAEVEEVGEGGSYGVTVLLAVCAGDGVVDVDEGVGVEVGGVGGVGVGVGEGG